ncbi:hypothetical protein [uncultured Aureimonas sp.]|uniref:hypothetical protein n=1 Tax=uncultured Aureimonas sp. TaxID=1604662 RepID=UPI0025F97173|nr:hypothetical protein [uncultured Aureimonas sp.]
MPPTTSPPPAQASALERRFQLEPGESATVVRLLGEALAGFGPQGHRLAAALGADTSPAAALGFSRGALEALYARATQWFAVGRRERAEPLFRLLCLLDGGDADMWVAHGVCLHIADRIEAAELAFRTAAALRPTWAVPSFHLAAIALRTGDGAEARRLSALFAVQAEADPLVPLSMRREAERLAIAVTHRERQAAP